MKGQHISTTLVTVALGATIATSYSTPIASQFGQRLVVLEQKVDHHGQIIATLDPQKHTPTPLAGTYTVRKGDSLSKIARKYGVTTADLVRRNQLPSADKIRIGQKLSIATQLPKSTESPTTPHTHEVQKGETLYSIARKYGVSFREFQAHNGLSDPRMIWGGQILRVPTTGSHHAQLAKATTTTSPVAGYHVPTYAAPNAGSKAGGHTVVRGETLTKIARAHGISVRQLQEANGITNPRALRIGQTLTIPTRSTAAPPATIAYKKPTPPKPAAPRHPPITRDLGDDEYLGYYVYAGDTVESIASTLGTDPSLLRRINDVPTGSQFKAGQQILVPASAIFDS